MSRGLIIWPVLCSCLVLGGCSDPNLPEVATVTGRVIYKGQPVPDADVSFVPENGDRPASGRTDSSGRFRLGTFYAADGALPGKHRISIIARGPNKPLPPGEIGTGMPGETMPGDPRIPEKYFSPDTSGLAREVVRGSNDFDLSLD